MVIIWATYTKVKSLCYTLETNVISVVSEKKKKQKNTNFYMLVTLLSSPTLLQYLILTTLESDSYYYLRTEKQRIRNFKNLLKIKLVVNKGIHLARLSSIGSTLLNYSTMGPPL